MADDAVGTDNIQRRAVETANLATGAVTSRTIQNHTVGSTDLKNNLEIENLKILDKLKAKRLYLGGNSIADGVMSGDWDFGSGNLSTTGNLTTSGTITAGTFAGSFTGGFAPSGDVDMLNHLMVNIGNAGTDFNSLGGLTLANALVVSTGGANITGVITTTGGNSTNWNTAYGWGNHATMGYLTAASTNTLTNKTWNGAVIAAAYLPANVMYQGNNISLLTNNTGFITASTADTLTNKSGNISMWTNNANYITDGNTNWDNSYGFITASTTDTLANKTWNGVVIGASYLPATLMYQGNNISLLTNNSGYITDGNTNWDNSYGFITAATSDTLTNKTWNGAVITSTYLPTTVLYQGNNISLLTNNTGFITDGNTNWDNSYGFITAATTDTLTNKSGNISMWTNDAGYLTSASGGISGSGTLGYLPRFTGTSSLGNSIIQDNGTALNVTGNINLTGSIIPTADNIYSLGSPTNMWKDVYVGPGSIYVNGQEVLYTDLSKNVNIGADPNQGIFITTYGSGDIQFNPSGTGVIQLKGDVQLTAGKTFRTSTGVPLNFSDGVYAGNVSLASNLISVRNTNGSLELAANGLGAVYVTTGNFGLGTTGPLEMLDVNGRVHLAQTTVPGTVTDRLYNVGGSLFWNGVNVSGGVQSLSGYALLAGISGGQTLIGGTAVTDILKLQGTSGNGTSTSPAIQALVGNNGATTALTVLNNGNVGIGTTSPATGLNIYKSGTGGFDSTTSTTIRASYYSTDNAHEYYFQMSPQGFYSDSWQAMNFYHGGTKMMTLNSITGSDLYGNGASAIHINGTNQGNGNVGIGTTSPVSKLSIESSGSGVQNLLRISAPSSGGAANFDFNTNGGTGLFQLDSVGNLVFRTNQTGLYFDAQAAADIHFRTTDSRTERLTILNGGNVGIGTTSPSYKLDVQTGSAEGYVVTATGAWGNSSDERLKKNIVPMGSELDTVMALQPVTYNMKTESDSDPVHMGFIAQDVQKLAPDLVSTGANGYMGISYAMFTPMLTKALQQLDTQVFSQMNILGGSLRITDSQGNVQTFGNREISASQNREMTLSAQNINLIGNVLANGLNLNTAISGLTDNQNKIVSQLTGQLADESLSVNDKLNLIGDNLTNVQTQDLASLRKQIADLKDQFDAQTQNFASLQDGADKNTQDLADLQTQMEELKNQNQTVVDFAAALSVDKDTNSVDFGTWNINVAGINAASINLTGDLTAQNVTAATVKGDALQGNSLQLSSDTSGKSTLKTGETEVKIETPAADAGAKIYITPVGNTFGQVLYVDEITDGQSFKVKMNAAQDGDIKFNWLIVK